MIASTEKAGAGTNMQERLAALHHLDGPWRPSDVEQREGRILRCPFTDKLARLTRYASNCALPFYVTPAILMRKE
jgi:hypothetical protein